MVTNSIQRDKDTTDSSYWVSEQHTAGPGLAHLPYLCAPSRGLGLCLCFQKPSRLLCSFSAMSGRCAQLLEGTWLGCYFWLGLNSEVLERMFVTLLFWEFIILCLAVPDSHSDNRLVDHGIHSGARAEGWWKWWHQSSSLVAGSEQTTSLAASFIYSFVHLFIFYLFLAMPCGMWDLGSPTRDWTHATCSGSTDV